MLKVNIALLFALTATLFAQFETATVLGTLKDPTGAMIAGGKVTLENTKTGVATTVSTNDAGNFDFISVPIGTYRVKAAAKGFTTTVTEEFTVTVSARQRVDVTLAVGEMTQTIAVHDAAATLETESSDRGQVINNVTIVNLPLN